MRMRKRRKGGDEEEEKEKEKEEERSMKPAGAAGHQRRWRKEESPTRLAIHYVKLMSYGNILLHLHRKM